MKLINRVTLATTSLLFTAATFASSVSAIDIKPGTQEGSNSPIIGPTNIDVNGVIVFVLTALGVIAVLAALIWLILGAIKWIISGGDKEKVAAARGQIIAAIIGLVVVILSFVILNFVIEFVTGSNIFDLKLEPLSESIGEPVPATDDTPNTDINE